LAALYGTGGEPVDEGGGEKLTREVVIEDFETRLVHVRRYSARQGQKMDLPGVIGHFRWGSSLLP
jgi:hypothetical protein